MSSQNNMAKESSSLQNHIVRLCFIFITQKCSHLAPPPHPPPPSPTQCLKLKNNPKFSIFTQYMSASHGHSTMGGIEYDDGGYVEKTKKDKVSH